MRNNDLIKYITQLQCRIFAGSAAGTAPSGKAPYQSPQQHQVPYHGGPGPSSAAIGAAGASTGTSSPFAYIQSPVLYDPNLSLSYVATTTFSPASHDPITGAQKK